MKAYVNQPLLLAALGSWAAYFCLWLNWYELAADYLKHGDVPDITGPSILFMQVFLVAAALLSVALVLWVVLRWWRASSTKVRSA